MEEHLARTQNIDQRSEMENWKWPKHKCLAGLVDTKTMDFQTNFLGVRGIRGASISRFGGLASLQVEHGSSSTGFLSTRCGNN